MINQKLITAYLSALMAIIPFNATSATSQEASAWSEGFLHGYIAGRVPPERVLCPLKSSNSSELLRGLSYIKTLGATDFRITKVTRDQQKRHQVDFNLFTPRGGSEMWFYLIERGESFCINDVFGVAAMQDIMKKTRQEHRSRTADDIYK
jgi:hypothetical protein